MKKLLITSFLFLSTLTYASPDGYLAYDGSNYADLTTTNSTSSGDVILLDGLDYPALYWIWPYGVQGSITNYGKAFAVNRAESMFLSPWWREPGEEFSIFGTALSLTNTVPTRAWCVEEDEWITAVESDFYRAQFVIPDDWTTGDKTLYIHNGYGNKYGLDPNPVSVLVTNYIPVYNGPTNTVAGTDWASITAAFAQLNPGETLYFPEGIYRFENDFDLHEKYSLNHDFRILGDGPDKTIIMPATNYADNVGHKFFFDGESNWSNYKFNGYNIKFEGIRFDAGNASKGLNGFIQLNGWNNCISNCAFTVSNFVMTVGTSANLDNRTVGMDSYYGDTYGSIYRYAPNFFVSNTVEVLNRVITGKGTWVEGNTFIGYSADKTGGALFSGQDASEIVLINNTFLQADPDSTNVLWGCGGRVIVSQNNYRFSRNEYIAGNVTVGFGPPLGKTDQNSGEMILWEGVVPYFRDSPSSATLSNITFDVLNLTNPEYVYTVVYSTGVCIETNLIASITGNYSNSNIVTIAGTWATTPINNTHYIRIPSRMGGDRAFGTITSNSLAMTTLRFNKSPTSFAATIDGGKGMGQTRRIVGYDLNTGTCEVYPNWNIAPDTTSTIVLSTIPMNTIIHNNHFESGRNWNTSRSTAAVFASLYGGSSYFYIDGNTASNLMSVLDILSYNYKFSGTENIAMSTPSMFSTFRNNKFENIRDGINIRVGGLTPITEQTPIYGLVFNNNLIKGSWKYTSTTAGSLSGSTQKVDVVVFNRNTFDGNNYNDVYVKDYSQNILSINNTQLNTDVGTNLVHNGTFDTVNYWSHYPGSTISNNTLTMNVTSFRGATQGVPNMISGVNYTIECDVVATSGSLRGCLGTVGTSGVFTIGSTSGHKKITKTYLSSYGPPELTFNGGPDFVGTIDNVIMYPTP